ncbi:oxidoreductase [Pedobacter caeni]|uniref:NADH:flavin oxidoreductase / NADH oxidase family protein n=1 Tax=Pedobacter caeni TaxID=288992 RepID=A0A1M5BXA9_9SPHI|nr:hypothetical protein [Pedobacter caeni]SHF47041.1 NADH:flavin oxidoreductase / NADH oxidase family protein [Pedobacter caeni]
METALIFEPHSLNGLILNNRIIMAPMTMCRSANAENTATALTSLYYKQRASAGLIITEGTFISGEAIGVINVSGIYTRQQIQGWKLRSSVE